MNNPARIWLQIMSIGGKQIMFCGLQIMSIGGQQIMLCGLQIMSIGGPDMFLSIFDRFRSYM